MRVVAIFAFAALCAEASLKAVGRNDRHEVAQRKLNATPRVEPMPLRGSMLQVMDGIKAELKRETTAWEKATAKMQAEHALLQAAEQEHAKLVEEGKNQHVQLDQQMAALQSKAQLIEDSRRALKFQKGNITHLEKEAAALQVQKYDLAVLLQNSEGADQLEDEEVQKAVATNKRAISAASAKLEEELSATSAKDEASNALLRQLKEQVTRKEAVLAEAQKKAAETQHVASVDATLVKSGRALLGRASAEINQTRAAEDKANARAVSAQQQLRDIAKKAIKVKNMQTILSAPVDNDMDTTAGQLEDVDGAW